MHINKILRGIAPLSLAERINRLNRSGVTFSDKRRANSNLLRETIGITRKDLERLYLYSKSRPDDISKANFHCTIVDDRRAFDYGFLIVEKWSVELAQEMGIPLDCINISKGLGSDELTNKALLFSGVR